MEGEEGMEGEGEMEGEKTWKNGGRQERVERNYSLIKK